MKNRFFVDERSGIVAVRDRVYTDLDYNGLHSDTGGVIESWSGKYNPDTSSWSLEQQQIKAANDLCQELNNGANYVPDGTWKQYICEEGHRIEYDYYENTATCPCGVQEFF
jgi:hypothetical protein